MAVTFCPILLFWTLRVVRQFIWLSCLIRESIWLKQWFSQAGQLANTFTELGSPFGLCICLVRQSVVWSGSPLSGQAVCCLVRRSVVWSGGLFGSDDDFRFKCGPDGRCKCSMVGPAKPQLAMGLC